MPRRPDRPRRSLDFDHWPEADRSAWQRALAKGDPLEADGLAAHWRPKTAGQVMKGYSLWLGWLSNSGILDRALPPEERATPERLYSYITDLQQRQAPCTVVSRLTDLSEALRVMAPHFDRSTIRTLRSRLAARAGPSRYKKARIAHPTDLFQVGIDLMAHAESAPHRDSLINASRYRDGLIIALLAARPIRVASLTQIRIGRHLLRNGDGYALSFASEETKNARELDVTVPAALTAYFDRYLGHYRGVLLRGRGTNALWISLRGSDMKEHTIYMRVTQRTRESLGRAISPHLFRDSLATSIAEEDPQHVRMAAVILGHASLATTEEHYNHANMLTAVRRMHEALAEHSRRVARDPKLTR